MSALRLNEILNRLSGVKSVGREHYLALCPCHDDHRPSLDIAVKNNKILMCCPVCGADGVKVMQTLGLNARDLFDDSKCERPERPASVDYYYSDKLKKTRFYVWDDKTQGWSKSFCWYHKGERGQQVKGLPKDSDGSCRRRKGREYPRSSRQACRMLASRRGQGQAGKQMAKGVQRTV